jgi:hypothetical protein
MRSLGCLYLSMLLPAAAATAADSSAKQPLSAQRIVQKNVAARGGLEVWRKIQTMTLRGHIESNNPTAFGVGFVYELKRGNKTRFELSMQNQKTVRVFDGAQGATIRVKQGHTDVQPYTRAEVQAARDWPGMDGPLIDYAAKGSAVALEGTETLEGHPTYRLKVTLASGARQRVWVDAHSFLDFKLARQATDRNGLARTVETYYRNFQSVQDLQIPMTVETPVQGGQGVDRLVIEAVALNPPLDDRDFSIPAGSSNSAGAPRPRGMPSWITKDPEPGAPAIGPAPAGELPPR